jgi:hypothetical protein
MILRQDGARRLACDLKYKYNPAQISWKVSRKSNACPREWRHDVRIGGVELFRFEWYSGGMVVAGRVCS